MKISEISIKRPSIIIVLFIMLTLGGLFSYKQLSYELIPKMENNVITVQTVYPGASPSEVENTITKKIEDAVSSMENVKKIEAKSFESLSLVTITLNTGADVNYLITDAQRKINMIMGDLPDDVRTPALSKFSFDDLPIMNLSITSKLSEKELYELLDKKIQPIFSRINGVARVTMIGGQKREIRVNLDPQKLEGYGLSVVQIQQSIAASNLDFPTGNIKTREKQTIIRLVGKISSVEEMRNLPIVTLSGQRIRLGDVADIQDSEKDVEKIARINQRNTILFQITKQSDANAVQVSQLIKNAIETVQKNYMEQGVKIDIANDTSDYTLNAARNVIFDLFLAIVLVGFIMFFFLRSLRNALITMMAIPLSLIATFIGLYLMSYTLNLMSLLGLSLVVGILVDDAIVVIENIHRHMEMGKNKVRAAYDGAAEIGFTVTAITLVIVVVFLPISVANGLVADILVQFCVTVMISTMFSLLVSFTVVPWLYSRFGKLEHFSEKYFFGKMILGFENMLVNFTNSIGGLLKWALSSIVSKLITLVVVALMFFASVSLIGMGYIGGDFFPRGNKSEFLVQFELERDASIEMTNSLTQKAEAYIHNLPEVEKIITTVGQASDGMSSISGSKYKSEIQVFLKKGSTSERTDIYAAKLKRELEKIVVGAKVKNVSMGLVGAEQAPIHLTVIASDLESALDFAHKASEQLKKIPGTAEVKLTSESGNPEINVKVDREKMTHLGLNLASVGGIMQTAFSGNIDSKFRAGDYEYDINIRYDEIGRTSIDDIRNVKFINDMGQTIRLEQFATVEYGSGPSQLERRDKSPSVSIQAKVVGRPSGMITAEWQEQFSRIERKSGVSYIWGGNAENQSEGFGTLGIALLAAIVLMYLVMVVLYDSFTIPFIVIFSIPLSFIGALLLMALTNQTLNVFTILGIIMLIGLVAKNAIMLVDFANHRKEEGDSTFDALYAANQARIRPILMTTIAMVIGMIPIAVATGDGADINRGVAIVIIGGLISSLFLTLVVIPVVYSIFDGIGRRFGKKGKIDYAKEMTADYVENKNNH